MIASKVVEQGRNPNCTLEEIENELKRVLFQKRVIWVNEGVADDRLSYLEPFHVQGKTIYTCNATGGHVDEYEIFNDSKF